jgi:hypothetical protein
MQKNPHNQVPAKINRGIVKSTRKTADVKNGSYTEVFMVVKAKKFN